MKHLLTLILAWVGAAAQNPSQLYVGGTPLDSIHVTYLSFTFYSCRMSETSKKMRQSLALMKVSDVAPPPRNWTNLCYCEKENSQVSKIALRNQDGSYVVFRNYSQVLDILYDAGWEYVDAVLSVSDIYQDKISSSTDYIIKRRTQ